MSSLQPINLKNLAANKIRTLLEDFQQDSPFGEQLIVLSRGETIYKRTIIQTDINRNSNCQKLINADKKIINLGDYQIDCSNQPNKQSYIKNLFNKFTIFLSSGYMQLEQKYLMDIIYISIILEIQKANWMLKLAVKVHNKYYEKLWDIILLVFNNNMKIHYEVVFKLIQNNPNFLIDQVNSQNIVSKYLNLKSLDIVESFLKVLNDVITTKGKQQVDLKTFTLIQTLYKYYFYKNNISPDKFSSRKCLELMGNNISPDVLFKNKDVSIDQLIKIVKKKQDTFTQNEKQSNEKQHLLLQIKQLENQINKLRQVRQENIEKQKVVNRLTQLGNVTNSNKIIHHPTNLSCQCIQSIKLQCGHQNCLSCSYSDISRYEVKKKKIQQCKIRCLRAKYPDSPCDQIWDTQRYNALGQLLSHFFG